MLLRGFKCQTDFDWVGAAAVEAYLTDFAVDGNVARSTQNRASYALLYLFGHVLKREMGEVDAIRSSKGKQIPTVPSVDEIQKIVSHFSLIATLSPWVFFMRNQFSAFDLSA